MSLLFPFSTPSPPCISPVNHPMPSLLSLLSSSQFFPLTLLLLRWKLCPFNSDKRASIGILPGSDRSSSMSLTPICPQGPEFRRCTSFRLPDLPGCSNSPILLPDLLPPATSTPTSAPPTLWCPVWLVWRCQCSHRAHWPLLCALRTGHSHVPPGAAASSGSHLDNTNCFSYTCFCFCDWTTLHLSPLPLVAFLLLQDASFHPHCLSSKMPPPFSPMLFPLLF